MLNDKQERYARFLKKLLAVVERQDENMSNEEKEKARQQCQNNVLEESTETELREQLAEYAHKAWSGWMVYMFKRMAKNEDGTVTMPADLVKRWTRQMKTDYCDLPEVEQKSDLCEADAILNLINDAASSSTRDAFRFLIDEGVPLKWFDRYDDTTRDESRVEPNVHF